MLRTMSGGKSGFVEVALVLRSANHYPFQGIGGRLKRQAKKSSAEFNRRLFADSLLFASGFLTKSSSHWQRKADSLNSIDELILSQFEALSNHFVLRITLFFNGDGTRETLTGNFL